MQDNERSSAVVSATAKQLNEMNFKTSDSGLHFSEPWHFIMPSEKIIVYRDILTRAHRPFTFYKQLLHE